MNIGMVLDKQFPPDPRVENEAIVLAQNGFKVFLFCLTYTPSEVGAQDYKGFTVVRYLSSQIEYKSSAIAYDVPFYHSRMQKKIQQFMLDNDIDVWHIHDMRTAKAVYTLNKRVNLPVVLDLHDNYPEIMKYYPHMQKFPGKYIISPRRWKQGEQECIEKATKVISVSYALVDELKQRIPQEKEKVILVPNTVTEDFYKKAVTFKEIEEQYKDDFVLLYVGDTHIRRGLLTAIEAVYKLKEEIPNIKLVIVGKSTTDFTLKDKVKELDLENFVRFEGWQDVKKFPSYIKSANVGLSPLHRNPQHDVAYANKIFQCMSFSIPLLVSDAPAQKELVQKIDSGWIHRDRDADDFAKQVLEIYKNPLLAKQKGENGHRFIEEEFKWEKVSHNLIDIYQNIENNLKA